MELVTDQVMVNHGFGNEDVAALRRDAIDEFGDAPTHNQRELQEIINNLDNVADERSPETSSIANIANLASRPVRKRFFLSFHKNSMQSRFVKLTGSIPLFYFFR